MDNSVCDCGAKLVERDAFALFAIRRIGSKAIRARVSFCPRCLAVEVLALQPPVFKLQRKVRGGP